MFTKTLAIAAVSVGLTTAFPHFSGHGFHHRHGAGAGAGAAAANVDTTTCTDYSTVIEYTTVYDYVTASGNAPVSTTAAGITITSKITSTITTTITPSATANSTSLVGSAGIFIDNKQYGHSSGSASTTLATSAITTTSLAATTSAASASTGSKKGLSYNVASLLNLFSGSDASWAYNWGMQSDGKMPSGVEYVPMCWGSGDAANCASTVLSNDAQHVLSFNEPDLGSQANLDVGTAVKLHIENIANKLAGKVVIGSPAVTNSDKAGQGIQYMQSFLNQCNGNCAIDFIAMHWYAEASAVQLFKDQVTAMIALAAQHNIDKVWITEFAATGSAAQQVQFLSEVIPWLESQPAVARYAYFMCGSSQGMGMVDGSVLNTIGAAYAA